VAKDKELSRRVSRRQFTKGAALGAVGAAATTLSSAAQAQSATAATPWAPMKWDYETDVVICGMGFAGQAAAIEADRA
jgi:anaerobic selenocysteine-containing dehydrogenase